MDGAEKDWIQRIFSFGPQLVCEIKQDVVLDRKLLIRKRLIVGKRFFDH